MLGLLAENGPCYINSDSNSTRLNPDSWNNEVNMLYIDQPVQVGLSYDSLKNFTLDLLTGERKEITAGESIPGQNSTFLVGTYPSDNSNSTSQGSRNAAMAMWQFAQVWFQEFPEYHPNDSRISLSTESCKSSINRPLPRRCRIRDAGTDTSQQTVGDTGPPSRLSSKSKMRRSTTK